jgi:chromosome segregation ATPase
MFEYINSLEADINRLELDHDDLNSNYDDLKEKYDRLKAEYNELEDELSRLVGSTPLYNELMAHRIGYLIRNHRETLKIYSTVLFFILAAMFVLIVYPRLF